jgi:hypothetical protein
VVTAAKTGDSVAIESKGGSLTYKALVDAKRGGDISDLCLPADGGVVAGAINDIFFLGAHGEEFTIRGWTGPGKFTKTCAVSIVSQKPDEAVVQVDLLTTGTFKILVEDPAAKAALRKTHASYTEKAVQLKRTYTFKPDRVLVEDEMVWLYPEANLRTCYFLASFVPNSFQCPVRLMSGVTSASFYETGSGGEKLPAGIAYPATAENFLKNGCEVSVRTVSTSFDLTKSDMYTYEKTWQQDWDQVSGFMYRVTDVPAGKPVTLSHEIVFSKAATDQMPPVVTLQSPPPAARWMDEKGEVAKCKIGDTVKLVASAVNSDGTPVPAESISWTIHIDPWWNTRAVSLKGAVASYTLPDVTNEVDKTKSKDRNLLAVITVTVKGKNGREAVEPFAMLVGKTEK